MKKFTQEVPREKVLKIESVMDERDQVNNLSDFTVSKDSIIETVAEKILGQEKSVAVVDENNNNVGIINPAKIIRILFGEKKS